MNLENELLKLKKRAEDLKTQYIQTQTTLKSLEKEKEALLVECSQLSVDPAKIADTVLQTELVLEKDLKEVETKINEVENGLYSL